MWQRCSDVNHQLSYQLLVFYLLFLINFYSESALLAMQTAVTAR